MPASMQGEMQPSIYRFKLGGFEVATILDGKSVPDSLDPNLGNKTSSANKLFFVSFHFPFPGIGTVEKAQGGYRRVPHSYQLNL